MADYTPTDGEILTAVVLYRAISSVDAPPPTIDTIATPEETARYLSEYKRWLAEHDAKARTEIADEIEAERLDTGDGIGFEAYINGLRRAEEIAREGRT